MYIFRQGGYSSFCLTYMDSDECGIRIKDFILLKSRIMQIQNNNRLYMYIEIMRHVELNFVAIHCCVLKNIL